MIVLNIVWNFIFYSLKMKFCYFIVSNISIIYNLILLLLKKSLIEMKLLRFHCLKIEFCFRFIQLF